MFTEKEQEDILEFLIFNGTLALQDQRNVRETAFKGGEVKKFDLSEDEIMQEGL